VVALRRGKKQLAGTVILLCMLLAIALLLAKTVFVVRSVEITGNSKVSSNDIVRASGIQFGESLSNVNIDEAEKGINATGRVKFISLEKKLPNKVEMRVSERKPAAMVLHMGYLLILDKEGCVIETSGHVPNEDLIYVSDLGVENYRTGSAVYTDSARIQAYTAVMDAVEYHAAGGMVSEINFADAGDIRIITRSGITVRFGGSEKARDKIAWMKAACADLEHRGEGGGVLDVSSASKADYTPAALLRG